MFDKLIKAKRGLFDIEDFFAMLVYIIILFMFLVVLSLPKCSGDKALQGLTSEAESIHKLNGEQLLLEMLRTRLPDNLPQLINDQKSKKILTKFTVYYGVAEVAPRTFETEESFPIYNGLDTDAAIKLLKDNKQIYRGWTYSEFINNLQFVVSDSKARSNVFAVVTRAMFVREFYPPHVVELEPELKDALTYPEVYVKYGSAQLFKKDVADLVNPPPETKPVKTSFGGTVTVIQPSIGEAIAFVPLSDASIDSRTATILLTIRPGPIE